MTSANSFKTRLAHLMSSMDSDEIKSDPIKQADFFKALLRSTIEDPDRGKGEEDANITDYKYAVSEFGWWDKFMKYLGLKDGYNPGQTSRPGPVAMDVGKNNIYISGDQWSVIIQWYGIDPSHHLLRVPVTNQNDPIQLASFHICFLNPLSNMIHHTSTRVHIDERVGYLEMRLRFLLRVKRAEESRLWSTRGTEPFAPLFQRNKLLKDCISTNTVYQPDAGYRLALELRNPDGTWPSGNYDSVTGDLQSYLSVTHSYNSLYFWQDMYSDLVSKLWAEDSDNTWLTVQKLTRRARLLLKSREDEVNVMRRRLNDAALMTTQLEEELSSKISGLVEREKQLDWDKEVFHSEKRKFDSEKEFIRKTNSTYSSEDIIILNVGGFHFTTTRKTLTSIPDSMLGSMFSGRHTILRQDSGAVYIERDGRYFHHVLSFLRDGLDAWLPVCRVLDSLTLTELRREADFYVLDQLYKACDKQITVNLDNQMVPTNTWGELPFWDDFEETTEIIISESMSCAGDSEDILEDCFLFNDSNNNAGKFVDQASVFDDSNEGNNDDGSDNHDGIRDNARISSDNQYTCAGNNSMLTRKSQESVKVILGKLYQLPRPLLIVLYIGFYWFGYLITYNILSVSNVNSIRK